MGIVHATSALQGTSRPRNLLCCCGNAQAPRDRRGLGGGLRATRSRVWDPEPRARPSFDAIIGRLEGMQSAVVTVCPTTGKRVVHEQAPINAPRHTFDDPRLWTVTRVSEWLRGRGLASHSATFTANDVDGRVLLSLSSDDMRTALGIKSFGERRTLELEISALCKLIEAHDVRLRARHVEIVRTAASDDNVLEDGDDEWAQKDALCDSCYSSFSRVSGGEVVHLQRGHEFVDSRCPSLAPGSAHAMEDFGACFICNKRVTEDDIGMVCKGCRFVVHSRCRVLIEWPCSSPANHVTSGAQAQTQAMAASPQVPPAAMDCMLPQPRRVRLRWALPRTYHSRRGTLSGTTPCRHNRRHSRRRMLPPGIQTDNTTRRCRWLAGSRPSPMRTRVTWAMAT
eukprot:Opistho-2@62372